MSSPSDDKPEPPFSDSDLQWYAALSGEALADPESPAAREGQALRIALEQRRQEMALDPTLAAARNDESQQRQLQQLRQRVRREGVFDRPPATATIAAPAAPAAPAPPAPTTAQASNVIAFPWWRRRGALVAMAASVLMAAVLVQQLTSQPDYAQPPAMLGADGVQALRVPQPRASAEQLAERLRQAGLRPGLYQRGKTYVVDVNLMAAELPLADPGFAALRIKPALGFNRVEFSPS